MAIADSYFARKFAVTENDLESYLGEALSQGGDYADLYFEYVATSAVTLDEGIVKSASQGVTMGVGIRVISGERTGYAYSDDLAPERIKHAARTAACIASGPSQVLKHGLLQGEKRNLYPVLTPPHGARPAGQSRPGKARRRRRPGLRFARLSMHRHLRRSGEADPGGHLRRRDEPRYSADGAFECFAAGEAGK